MVHGHYSISTDLAQQDSFVSNRITPGNMKHLVAAVYHNAAAALIVPALVNLARNVRVFLHKNGSIAGNLLETTVF
jgi:uncharacterized protein YfaA (DUF2138 family)